LLNVHWFNDFRQTEVHTAEQLAALSERWLLKNRRAIKDQIDYGAAELIEIRNIATR
jgi:hypothetical protein